MMHPDDFVHLARSLPIGAVRKFRHNCGSRESMAVGNEATHYWAFCHRCQKSGKQDKRHVFDPTPAPALPRKPPTDLRPLEPVDLADAGRNRLQYDRWIVGKISELRYSPSYKRVYLPGARASDLGYDLSGKAQANWYATSKSQVFARPNARALHDADLILRVCTTAPEFLSRYKYGPCLGILPRGGWVKELANFLIDHALVHVYVGSPELREELERELSVFGITVWG